MLTERWQKAADECLKNEDSWIRFQEQALLLSNLAAAGKATFVARFMVAATDEMVGIGIERGVLDKETGEWKKEQPNEPA